MGWTPKWAGKKAGSTEPAFLHGEAYFLAFRGGRVAVTIW